MNLLDFFAERVATGQPLVLATVVETTGSTYSKAGGQMLIDSDGNFFGMLSGGCLEGDLVERARRVIERGEAESASYDLSADDELWGLGVGCDGTLRVLLQRLTRKTDYQPFAAIADVLGGQASADMAIVISAQSPQISAGASALFRECGTLCFGMTEATADVIAGDFRDSAPPGTGEVALAEDRCEVFFTRLTPLPALLVLGAGLDAEPVVTIADELGWRCTVFDHRPAYAESRAFPPHTRVLCHPVDDLRRQTRLDAFDAAIVMSHHLASDRSYLRQLAATNIDYVGLLGPIKRRARLMTELGDIATTLEGRLHGPAGIDLGGRGPGAIALSIIAEIQQVLSERS